MIEDMEEHAYHTTEEKPIGIDEVNHIHRYVKPEIENVFCLYLSDSISTDRTLVDNDVEGLRRDLGMEDGEYLEDMFVYLSVASAMKTAEPDRTGWINALSKEEARVKSYGTFGPPLSRLQVAKLKQEGVNILPVCILLNRKRDLSYKARAVILGNREQNTGAETYSSVVSSAGNRYLLVSSIVNSHELLLFDLDNAFLNAEIGEDQELYCLLPKEWKEGVESGIRRLRRALYGLRRAPRAWSTLYATKLHLRFNNQLDGILI